MEMEIDMTIYDIASEAGVSITTVSRVINQKPGIRQETRERVQEVLAKHNYLPNPSAKGLADRNSHMIALVVSDIRDIHYSGTVYMVEQELSRKGYHCLLVNTGDEPEHRVEVLRSVMQKQVEGVVMIGSTFQEKYIQKAIPRLLPSTPVVMANAYLPLPNVYGILCDGRKGIKQAVGYLAENGHKHISFVGGTQNASAREKRKGYLDGMENCGLTQFEDVRESRNEVWDGERATRKLLEDKPETTAIIYEGDLIAIGGIHASKQLGLRIPEDISMIGFDNSIYAQISVPGLTSIDDQLGVMGIKCAQTLCDVLEGNTMVAQMMLIPVLTERESVKLSIKITRDTQEKHRLD